jgi:hypothetical protein
MRKSTLKEERFVLAHGFSGFNPWSAGFIAFGPVARQNTMAGSM